LRLCSLATFTVINVCYRLSLYFYDGYCAVDFAEEKTFLDYDYYV